MFAADRRTFVLTSLVEPTASRLRAWTFSRKRRCEFFRAIPAKCFPRQHRRERLHDAQASETYRSRSRGTRFAGVGRVKRHQHRRLLTLLLVSGLFTIVPLAHGSPPDPTWVAGLYDDGDHDDVVLGITSASGLPPMDAIGISRGTFSSRHAVLLESARILSSCRISPVDRAPPSC
jgi:hypothetical protein